MAFIAKLYEVAAHCRENNLSDSERKACRLDGTTGRLLRRLQQNYLEVLPKSPIGGPMVNTMKLWEKLTSYRKEGMLQSNNHAVVNIIRPIRRGMEKLPVRSIARRGTAAMIYSFFAMCKAEEVNPQQWIK